MGAGRGRRGLAWDLIPEQPEAPIYSTVAYFSLLNGQTYLSAPRRPEWGPQQLGALFSGAPESCWAQAEVSILSKKML